MRETLRLYFSFNLKAAILVLLTSFLAISCVSQKKENEAAEPVSPISVSQVEAASPIEISRSPRDIARCDRIKRLVVQREADYEKWGLMAVSLNDGRAICALKPRDLFSPASIQKVLTAAVALENLKPDFNVRTSVYAGVPARNGRIEGDLTLYGRGAPDFDGAAMTKLIGDLKREGIVSVAGNIVGDESYFKGDGLGDGWTWNEAQWYYGAEASALSYERNQVNVRIRGGVPSVDSDLIRLEGSLKPVESVEAIGLRRKLGRNEVYVWGNGTNLDARIAVNDPARYAAGIFKEQLLKNGISVDGEALSADWTNPADPEELKELASVVSEPLFTTIRRMNKDSVNIYAEFLIRAIGRKFGSSAPDKDPKITALRGNDLAGAAYIKKWIGEKFPAASRIAIHDGSGLSRLNRISPEILVRILIHAAKSPYQKPFTDSLPVSGRDGTLKYRLKRYSGRVFAKTGSVQYANSLAGYLNAADESIAFAIICNDETERNDSTATIDAIVAELLD